MLVLLSKAFLRRGHAVSVVTLLGEENDFYELPSQVQRMSLGISGPFQAMWRISALRKSILSTRPDVVISFIYRMNILTLMAMWGRRVPVVVSERSDPGAYRIRKIWDCLRWLIYPGAARVVVQSEGALRYFLPRFRERSCVIPNPVISPPVTDSSSNTVPDQLMILSIGRFIEEKRFALLIGAFSKLKEKHPEWKLTILGDGPLRNDLELLRHQLGLESHLHLPGCVKDPYTILREADLFVLSSRVEGFPMALCEAMACGLPVISTDCPSGPRDIIRDGVDGILVPPGDVDALAVKMDHLMKDEPERRRLGSRAVEVVGRFGIEKVISMWEEMLNKVIHNK